MAAFKNGPKMVYKTYTRFKPWGEDGWVGHKGDEKSIHTWLHPTVDRFEQILKDEVARQAQKGLSMEELDDKSQGGIFGEKEIHLKHHAYEAMASGLVGFRVKPPSEVDLGTTQGVEK